MYLCQKATNLLAAHLACFIYIYIYIHKNDRVTMFAEDKRVVSVCSFNSPPKRKEVYFPKCCTRPLLRALLSCDTVLLKS